MQFLCENIHRGLRDDIIYTNFSREFDTISHSILLHKLSIFEFSGSALSLIKYPANIGNYLQCNGFCSFEFVVTYGVPQGFNRGPFMFASFLGYLLPIVTCHVSAYADNVNTASSLLKILKRYKTILILFYLGVLTSNF